MSQHVNLSIDPGKFSGRARLFPLPSLVMFPHVVQPLHLFEPRYLSLLEDALADDKLITMALLEPHWEDNYEGRPPIDPTVCVGRILAHTQVEEGRWNILLAGLRRARIVQELPPERLYREARVELLDDVYTDQAADARPKLRRRLMDEFRELASVSTTAEEQLAQLLGGSLSLGMLTDIIASTLDLPIFAKQELLDECDVDRRARRLLAHLDIALTSFDDGSTDGFPPPFSEN